MKNSEELSRIYVRDVIKTFGKDPRVVTPDLFSLAVRAAFEYGYHEGEVSILKTIHGIPEKDTNENKRKNN